MRARMIWGCIVIGALFYLATFFLGQDSAAGETLKLGLIRTELSRAISVLATMALGLGVINLFYVHGGNIARRNRDWPFSVVVFVTFTVVFAFLLWQYQLDAAAPQLNDQTKPAIDAYQAAFALDDPVARDQALLAMDPADRAYAERYYEHVTTYQFQPREFYLTNFINPLSQTVMGLLGFYITFAAYRAFRVRSLEATVMMISATVVILGSDAVGGLVDATCAWMFGGVEIVNLRHWADLDNRVANSGMQRGLWTGISIAFIAVNLRILLGFERGLLEVRQSGD